jgi:hypothetical protein
MRALCLFLVAVCSCLGQATWIRSDAARVTPLELQTYLKSICPEHINPSGCDTCPDSSAFTPEKWTVQAVFLGHFLSPSSEDALVSGSGCEPHLNGYGGSFLFDKQQGSWHRVRYLAGMIAQECKKLSGSDGRDRLLCANADLGQGIVVAFLYLLDPGLDLTKSESPDHSSQATHPTFFAVEDNKGTGATPVQSGTIARVEFVNLARHKVRIVVSAVLGQATVPPEVIERAESALGPSPQVATVSRRYEFVFDGEKVLPGQTNPPMEGVVAVAPRTSYSIGK